MDLQLGLCNSFFKSRTQDGKRVSLSVYRKSAGRRLLNQAGVSGRFVKHGFVDCMVACKLVDVFGASLQCPRNLPQLLVGPVGLKRSFPFLPSEKLKKR